MFDRVLNMAINTAAKHLPINYWWALESKLPRKNVEQYRLDKILTLIWRYSYISHSKVMFSSRHVNVTAIAMTVGFAGKKSIIDVWKGPKYAFALGRMKNLQ